MRQMPAGILISLHVTKHRGYAETLLSLPRCLIAIQLSVGVRNAAAGL